MIKPFNARNWGGAGAYTRKAGDGQRSPTAVARPTERSRTSGADPSIARNHGLRATGSAGRVPSWAGRPPASARHTHATMSTTGNSVMTATIISARPPERSTRATAPNISATKSRLQAAKTLNLVLLDGMRKHRKKTNATKLTLPSTRAWCWAALIARRTCRRRGDCHHPGSPRRGHTRPSDWPRAPGVTHRRMGTLVRASSLLERNGRKCCLFGMFIVLGGLLVELDQEVAGGQVPELVQDGQGQDQRGQTAWYEDRRQVQLLRVSQFPKPSRDRQEARELRVPGVRDHMYGYGDTQVLSESIRVIFGLEPLARQTKDSQFLLKLCGREQGSRFIDARLRGAEVSKRTPEAGQPAQKGACEVTFRHVNVYHRPRVPPRIAG